MLAEPPGDWVEVEEAAAATVVRVTRASLWDDGEVWAVAGCLAGVLERAGSRPVVLDLSRVEHLSSSAVSTLVGLHQRALGDGVRLTLCGLAGQPALVFRTLRLAQLLSVCGDLHEALRSCGPSGCSQ